MREDLKRMVNLGIPGPWEPENSYNQKWLSEYLKADEDDFVHV